MGLIPCENSGLTSKSQRLPLPGFFRYVFLSALLLAGMIHGAGINGLTVGIFPRRDAETTREMFEPLLGYLQQELKLAVSLDVPPDFEAFWSQLEKSQYDLVHLNQYQYLRAHYQYGYNAILKNEEMGRSDIASVIWVRKHSGIRQPKDLMGQKVTFGGGRQAMVSYIMAVDLLRQHELNDGDYLSQFALNPAGAMLSLYYRQTTAAAAGDVLPYLLGLDETIATEDFIPLLTSQPVAQLPWAVSLTLPEALSHKIEQTMIGLKNTPSGQKLLATAGLSGFSLARDSDYDPHRHIVARVLREHY